MYAIRSYYETGDEFEGLLEPLREVGQFQIRITSYNVCYTKLLRTGISFNLPVSLPTENKQHYRSYSSAGLLRLMRDLQGVAEKYRDHGGIHSAAIGDEDGLLLYAEDIGRHNTLDRLAGEALFRQIDLRDKMLVRNNFV